MRAVSIFIIFFIVFRAQADQYAVFEKDGYFGIKDQAGQVKVPAVYDQLGWSNGSQAIINNAIGFKDKNSWGLISITNKVLAEPKFYSIEHFEDDLLKASIKGKFSNHLFYGLLTGSGKTRVSFNYFTLERFHSRLLVSSYDSRQKFGVIDYTNEILIPLKYSSIRKEDDLYYAIQFNSDIDLFNISGKQVCVGLDSLKTYPRGIVGYKNGFAGFFTIGGEVVEDFNFKEIEVIENVVFPSPFPTWQLFQGEELILEIEADSVLKGENEFWNAYVNGSHHLISSDSSFQFGNSFLMDVSVSHYLLKNSRSGKWSARTTLNETVLQGYDSIFIANNALWGQKNKTWEVYNRFGKKKNRFAYDAVELGLNGQFIVKLKNYWGILDPLGDLVSPIKYDAIEKDEKYYAVQYLGRQGIIDQLGDWVIRAEYEKVFVLGDLLIGRKGYSFSYFNNGRFLRRSTLEPLDILGDAILVKEDSLYGILDFEGRVQAEPKYNFIEWKSGFFTLKEDSVILLTGPSGNLVFDASLELEDIDGFTEDLFLIKKNGRWGFLDIEGRLRIGNRYDSARYFAENRAPVKVNGRWGFIDKEERLVIQPYYDKVSDFENGLSRVCIGKNCGIIDLDGNEVVKVTWKEITKLPTGNFRFLNHVGKFGLASHTGKILLRPEFDHLVDYGDRVLVAKNGFKGVLQYDGNQLFRIGFKEIKISGDFTILKH